MTLAVGVIKLMNELFNMLHVNFHLYLENAAGHYVFPAVME